jgi:Leu/Phe-tRNA-protein transferase
MILVSIFQAEILKISVQSHVIKWFAANNNLVLNLDKINIIKVIRKNSAQSTLQFGYKKKYI